MTRGGFAFWCDALVVLLGLGSEALDDLVEAFDQFEDAVEVRGVDGHGAVTAGG
jgi:hypothetical protein